MCLRWPFISLLVLLIFIIAGAAVVFGVLQSVAGVSGYYGEGRLVAATFVGDLRCNEAFLVGGGNRCWGWCKTAV